MNAERPTGRLYLPQFRDTEHMLTPARLAGIRAVQTKRRARPWRYGDVLDQGRTSRCVVFTYAAFRQAAPFYCRSVGWRDVDFTSRYLEAQKHDEIPGENYDGTTARGALKHAQSLGEVSEFLWVPPTDGEDIAREYLLTRGTLMLGTEWPTAFFTPGKNGYVEPGGEQRRDMGHEYLLRWYYGPRHRKYPDTYECINSYGRSYGDGGKFRMKADVFRWLVWQCNGDLVSPIETARVRAGGMK